MSSAFVDEAGAFYANDIKNESHNNGNNPRNSESKEDRQYLDLDKLKEEQSLHPWQTVEENGMFNRSDSSTYEHYGRSSSRNEQQSYIYKFIHPTSLICYPTWKSGSIYCKNMMSALDAQTSNTNSNTLLTDSVSDGLQYSNGKHELILNDTQNLQLNKFSNTGQNNLTNEIQSCEPGTSSGTELFMDERKHSDNCCYNISSINRLESQLSNTQSHTWGYFEDNSHYRYERKQINAVDQTSGPSKGTGFPSETVASSSVLNKVENKGDIKAVMRILLHKQTGTQPTAQQENVVGRYQVILPPLTMLQERKLKQVPLSYTATKPSHRVILTSDNMTVAAVESSTVSAISRRLHFRCQVCGERMATRNSLSTHIKSHRQPYCRFCFVVPKTTDQLRMHLSRVHPPKSPHHHVTVVTSKYGRRRQVLSTLALMKRRKKDD